MFLGRGWWFNRYPSKLYPGVGGEITVGVDTLEFTPDYPDTAAVRGTKLFNPKTLSYVFTEPVSGMVTQDVGFEELPESAAVFVLYSALTEAYVTDMGASQEFLAWNAKATEAYSNVVAEHLRQRKYSTSRSRRFTNILRAMRS